MNTPACAHCRETPPHEMRVCPACQSPDETLRLLLESRRELAEVRAIFGGPTHRNRLMTLAVDYAVAYVNGTDAQDGTNGARELIARIASFQEQQQKQNHMNNDDDFAYRNDRCLHPSLRDALYTKTRGPGDFATIHAVRAGSRMARLRIAKILVLLAVEMILRGRAKVKF